METGARKFDHITPVLRELHWLPVRQRIRLKMAMIVYKCIHGLAPSYLADDCVLTGLVCGHQTAFEIDGSWSFGEHELLLAPEISPSRQRCRLKLATYRSANLVTVCSGLCQTP